MQKCVHTRSESSLALLGSLLDDCLRCHGLLVSLLGCLGGLLDDCLRCHGLLVSLFGCLGGLPDDCLLGGLLGCLHDSFLDDLHLLLVCCQSMELVCYKLWQDVHR